MYGFWILAIVFGCITFVVAALAIVSILVEKYSKNYKLSNVAIDCQVPFVAIAIILSVVTILTLLVGGTALVKADKEYMSFCEMREMIKQLYDRGTELDNIAITTSLIEQNQWLASARANKKRLGTFSPYYYIDLESLEPITI